MELNWYYQIIRRSWRLIVVGTLFPGVLALVISAIMKPTYESQADVALYKTKADLAFDASFLSLAEDDLVHYANPDARRNTLVALAKSGEVLSKTLTRLPETWASEWTVGHLAGTIRVDTSGNLIQLFVESPDPGKAMIVCNAWAESFVEIANRTFSQPDEAVGEISTLVDQAYQQYADAQLAVQSFLENTQIDELTLAIDVKKAAVQSIVEAYSTSAQTSMGNLLRVEAQLPLLVGNAEALRQLVAAGPAENVDVSTQLATLLVQVGSLNTGLALPAELQLSFPAPNEGSLSRAEALARLDRIITELTHLQNFIDDLILSHGTETTAGLDPQLEQQLAAVQAEIDPLNARLEKENARLRELTAARDLAWGSYQTLARKAAETAISAQTIETEVVLASRAIAPEEPVRPQKVLNVGIGCAFGLLATLAFVLFKGHVAENPAGR